MTAGLLWPVHNRRVAHSPWQAAEGGRQLTKPLLHHTWGSAPAKISKRKNLFRKGSSTNMANVKISDNHQVRKLRGATSAVRISLYFLHSKSELRSRGTGVGYKIPPVKVCKRPTLPGLFQLSILCGVFLNSLNRPSFHNTIRTSLIMSSSIHIPGCSKRFSSFTISQFSTVIDHSPNLFQTSFGHE